MVRISRIVLLVALVIIPIFFYNSLNKRGAQESSFLPFSGKNENSGKPSIALIFDDLGENLNDLKELYSLDIPLTVSVIPNLKFSKNIAHIAARCGFSVFIHLPLEPVDKSVYKNAKYRFISESLSKREVESLMRRYLNSIRIAIGVNNHMGSKATQNSELMGIVLSEIKKKGLAFVDSRTSVNSVAYSIASDKGMVCGYNEFFLDSVDSDEEMQKRMEDIISRAKEKGKVIVIAHPRKDTIKFLKQNLSTIKDKVRFVNVKEYFEL